MASLWNCECNNNKTGHLQLSLVQSEFESTLDQFTQGLRSVTLAVHILGQWKYHSKHQTSPICRCCKSKQTHADKMTTLSDSADILFICERCFTSLQPKVGQLVSSVVSKRHLTFPSRGAGFLNLDKHSRDPNSHF